MQFFPSRLAHGGADLCFCNPQPDTSLHCKTTDMGLVGCVVFLLNLHPGFHLYSLRPPTEGCPDRNGLGGWLHTKMAYPSAISFNPHIALLI